MSVQDQLSHCRGAADRAGFEVVDIGINNPVENYLEALETEQPDILGMSALLTTTMPYMKVVIDTMVEQGLRDDTLFLFDLELPADFVPQNTDGELTGFELWDIGAVMARVRETDDFKFNVAPALIDFFLRHGLLDPDVEPDYLPIVRQLHAGA
jgi:hypothetical protein